MSSSRPRFFFYNMLVLLSRTVSFTGTIAPIAPTMIPRALHARSKHCCTPVMAAAVDDDELTHRLTYSVKGTGQGSVATMTNSRGQHISADVPKRFGGTDTAPTRESSQPNLRCHATSLPVLPS